MDFTDWLWSIPRDPNPRMKITETKIERYITWTPVPGNKIDGVWHHAWATPNVFEYEEL